MHVGFMTALLLSQFCHTRGPSGYDSRCEHTVLLYSTVIIQGFVAKNHGRRLKDPPQKSASKWGNGLTGYPMSKVGISTNTF